METLGERMGRVLISRAVRVLRSPTVLMFLARMSCPRPLALQQGRQNGLLGHSQGMSPAGGDPQHQQNPTPGPAQTPQPWGAFPSPNKYLKNAKIFKFLPHPTNPNPFKDFWLKLWFGRLSKSSVSTEMSPPRARSTDQMLDVIWGRMTSTGALQPARAGYTSSERLGRDSLAISVIWGTQEQH